jgi:integrase
MARPSYLCRREGGRYFLQLRVGNPHAELYGRKILRASLRTADFGEARRRLVDNLGWANELVAAPDLEAIGTVIDRRLQTYTAAGSPQSERVLAERVSFEHQARHNMSRANERGYAYARQFEGFASNWVTFVDQNKGAEAELARLGRQRDYERGRSDAATAVAQGWMPAPALPATGPVVLSDAVHHTIDALIMSKLGQHVAAMSTSALVTADGASPSLAPAAPAAGLKLSEALALFLKPPRKKLLHTTKGHADAAGIVQFAIDFLGDPEFDSINEDDWDSLDEAIADIPSRKNIPEGHRKTLFRRYCYAKKKEWKGLIRASVTTVRGRYHGGLDKFFKWAIKGNVYHGKQPEFCYVDENNLAPLPRDAFDDNELVELISLPLFTGCAGSFRVWTPGGYFVQSDIYWAYLILIVSGMRPGEVGQLQCNDLVTDGENYFFDLRPFDARKGRVAIRDLRNLKTRSSGRIIPLHPLLIELGLIDRMIELRAIGETRLFPEWECYTRPDGAKRWSQPISKSWQYVKKLLGTTRADLTLYSTRHLVADMLDAAGIAQRTRDRILGHVSGVPGRYGKKWLFSPEQVAAIEALEPPVVKAMRTVLLAAKEKADRGELVTLKPWLTSANGVKE